MVQFLKNKTIILFTIILGIFLLPKISQAAGEVATYSFNEGSGATAVDTSGNSNTSTISGAAWTTQGKYGNALNFDGVNDYISIGDNNTLDFVSSFTISAWIKPNSFGAGGGGRILEKRTGDATGYNFMLYNAVPNGLRLETTNGFESRVPSNANVIQVGVWQHVAVTFSGGTANFYVNGNNAGGGNIAAPLAGTENLFIGNRSDLTKGFDGLIDEVRVYNRALTQSEIQSDINTPIGGTPLPPPTPDTESPTIPTDFSAIAVSSNQINLSWSASSDNIGVTGYKIYRNGTQINTSAISSYSDVGLSPSTSYSYTVQAYDARGNNSGQSSTASATTQAQSAGQAIGLYDIFEASFTSAGNYTNPYTQTSMAAVFTGPSGQGVTVSGFWDGGSSWKIRMAPTAIGTWTYITSSVDAGLNAKSGTINAIASGKSGFVEKDPSNPWGWRTQGDQKPHFWMSDTNWRWAQKYTISQLQDYVNTRSSQGFNHVRGHFNSMDSGVSNEGGSPFSSDNWDTINPNYWQGIDTRLAYANSKGITMDLTVGSGDRWPSITSTQRDRYLKYLIARYSAYHITWEGISEYEENSNPTTLISAIGNFIKNNDPYQHPRSTHTLDSTSELASSGWLDWIMYQTGGPNPSTIISDRSYNKPLINEEYYYEKTCPSGATAHDSTSDQMRRGAWQVAVSGGYFSTGNTATYTGGSNTYDSCGLTGTGVSQMKHLYDFWTNNNIPYWQMSPQNSLATNGARCFVKIDDTYVCYKESGGSFNLNLSGANGTFSTERFNPRDGSFTSLSNVSGGSSVSFLPPDSNEWVFLAQKTITSDTTPPSAPSGVTVN